MAVLFITDNDYPNTLAFMKSFKGTGVKTFASVRAHKETYCLSRYLSGVFKHRDTGYSGKGEIKECDDFIDHIIRCVLKNNIKVILPVSASGLLPVLKYRDRITRETAAKIPFAGLNATMNCHDKVRFSEFMERSGYPYPRTFCPGAGRSPLLFSERLGYPLVVKPARGMGACESAIVFNEKQLSAFLGRQRDRDNPFILQEFIPGPENAFPEEYNVSILMDEQQAVKAFFCLKRVRTYAKIFNGQRLSQSTCFARAQEYKRLIEMSAAVLKDLRWSGIADVQFRIDARDNSPRILEINPRFAGTTPYAVCCGVNFPRLLYEMSLGKNFPLSNADKKRPNYAVIHKDVLVIFRHLLRCKDRRGFLAKCLFAYRQGTYCVDIDISDPLPYIAFFLRRSSAALLKPVFFWVSKLKRYAKDTFWAYFLKMRRMNSLQWTCGNELEKLQNKKLRQIISKAYQTDHYRELFQNAGIYPSDISAAEDLYKIPITTKDMLSGLPLGKRLSGVFEPGKDSIIKTSGSYSLPATVVLTENERMLRWFSVLRMYQAHGVGPRHKTMYIFNPSFIGLSKYPWLGRIGILSSVPGSVFACPEENLKILQKNNPDIIRGYASAIAAMASLIKKEKISIRCPIKKVFSTADELSGGMRALIEEAFGAKVADHYSASECGLIAWECPEHSGFHVDEDRVIVEVVDDSGSALRSGQPGRIIITCLDPQKMPFVRYDTGDQGLFSGQACACGRSFRLLQKVSGRKNDEIIFPDGRRSPAFALLAKMNQIDGIVSYQIVQTAAGAHDIYVIHSYDFDRLGLKVQTVYEDLFKGRIKARVISTDKIAHEHNGKKKAFVDLIKEKEHVQAGA